MPPAHVSSLRSSALPFISCTRMGGLCASLVQVPAPEKYLFLDDTRMNKHFHIEVSVSGRLSVPHWCRCLCLRGYLFLTCAGFCSWEINCSSLVQVSVPGRFSMPHWCRCLCLGVSLCLIGAGACTWEVLCPTGAGDCV